MLIHSGRLQIRQSLALRTFDKHSLYYVQSKSSDFGHDAFRLIPSSVIPRCIQELVLLPCEPFRHPDEFTGRRKILSLDQHCFTQEHYMVSNHLWRIAFDMASSEIHYTA